MRDYISREAAIEAVYYRIKQIGWTQNALALSLRQAIRDVPAADVREVVTCGECKYRHDFKRQGCQGRSADWFCADGRGTDMSELKPSRRHGGGE